MGTESDVLTNQTLDTLGYLIDKFNLTLEVSTNQIKDFSVQLSEKIVKWEFFTSLLAVAFQIIVLLLIFRLIEHFKIEKIQSAMKQYESITNKTDSESREKHEKLLIHIFIRVIAYFIILLTVCLMVGELRDIVLCTVFPERIILGFIGNYI